MLPHQPLYAGADASGHASGHAMDAETESAGSGVAAAAVVELLPAVG